MTLSTSLPAAVTAAMWLRMSSSGFVVEMLTPPVCHPGKEWRVRRREDEGRRSEAGAASRSHPARSEAAGGASNPRASTLAGTSASSPPSAVRRRRFFGGASCVGHASAHACARGAPRSVNEGESAREPRRPLRARKREPPRRQSAHVDGRLRPRGVRQRHLERELLRPRERRRLERRRVPVLRQLGAGAEPRGAEEAGEVRVAEGVGGEPGREAQSPDEARGGGELLRGRGRGAAGGGGGAGAGGGGRRAEEGVKVDPPDVVACAGGRTDTQAGRRVSRTGPVGAARPRASARTGRARRGGRAREMAGEGARGGARNGTRLRRKWSPKPCAASARTGERTPTHTLLCLLLEFGSAWRRGGGGVVWLVRSADGGRERWAGVERGVGPWLRAHAPSWRRGRRGRSPSGASRGRARTPPWPPPRAPPATPPPSSPSRSSRWPPTAPARRRAAARRSTRAARGCARRSRGPRAPRTPSSGPPRRRTGPRASTARSRRTSPR